MVLISILVLLIVTISVFLQNSEIIKLNTPDTGKGLPLMLALNQQPLVRGFDNTPDLSDLLWDTNTDNCQCRNKQSKNKRTVST